MTAPVGGTVQRTLSAQGGFSTGLPRLKPDQTDRQDDRDFFKPLRDFRVAACARRMGAGAETVARRVRIDLDGPLHPPTIR
jgi:hypothetical protein